MTTNAPMTDSTIKLENEYDFNEVTFMVNVGSSLTDDSECVEAVMGVVRDADNSCLEQRWFDPRAADDRATLHKLLDLYLDGIQALKIDKSGWVE